MYSFGELFKYEMNEENEGHTDETALISAGNFP